MITILIAVFSLVGISPQLQNIAFDEKYIPIGGAISGFFGGLSGLQGALRAAFLIRAGLDKNQFIGTGVISSVVVDAVRLAICGVTFLPKNCATLRDHGDNGLILAGIIFAWIGSFIGVRLLKKITIKTLQFIVGTALLILFVALGVGLI